MEQSIEFELLSVVSRVFDTDAVLQTPHLVSECITIMKQDLSPHLPPPAPLPPLLPLHF